MYGVLPIWEDPSYDNTSFLPSILTYPISLRGYIEEGKEIVKANRLASHGDVVKFLREALRLNLVKDRDLKLGETLDPKNKEKGMKSQAAPPRAPSPPPEPADSPPPTPTVTRANAAPPAPAPTPSPAPAPTPSPAPAPAPWLREPTGVPLVGKPPS